MAAAVPKRAPGAGLGYRRELHAEIFARRESIDCLELVADHFFDESRRVSDELELLREHFPLFVHGLDLSLGSAEGIDAGYLSRLARVVERAAPAWWSEHIAFTKAGGVRFGHLAPLPFSREAIATICRNVDRVQRTIAAPLILENVSAALELPGAEMDEASFIAEIARQTGCGLLLDVTNLHTNAVNRAFDARAYLERLPDHSVVQVHFAGGFFENGELIDSHSEATPGAVWELLAAVVERFEPRALILERDENFGSIDELLPELERARALTRGVYAAC